MALLNNYGFTNLENVKFVDEVSRTTVPRDRHLKIIRSCQMLEGERLFSGLDARLSHQRTQQSKLPVCRRSAEKAEHSAIHFHRVHARLAHDYDCGPTPDLFDQTKILSKHHSRHRRVVTSCHLANLLFAKASI